MRLFILILTLVSPALVSANTIIGLGQDNHLYSVIPTTGVVTDLGTMPIPATGGYGDIAFNPVTGGLYAISFDGTGNQKSVLYSVNLYNPSASTIIGTTGVKGLNALAVSSTGTMYAAGGPNLNQLYTVDQTTGNATLVGPKGGATYISDGDLEFDSLGNLYITSFNTTPDTLFTIDTGTGVGTAKLNNTGFSNIFGLAFENGVMYGFTNPGSGSGQVITINLSTGIGTAIVNYNALFMGATDITPEPGTMGIMAFGAAAILGLAYRKSHRSSKS